VSYSRRADSRVGPPIKVAVDSSDLDYDGEEAEASAMVEGAFGEKR
jgi:hypothetical protein